jgi:hypothetical protein
VSRIYRTAPRKKAPRIKIAILDSCVDREQANMPRERLKAVKPYCACPPEEAKPCSSTHILGGELNKWQWEHGTHVTALLSKMTPFADIYVAEVGPSNERFKDKHLVEVSHSKPATLIPYL